MNAPTQVEPRALSSAAAIRMVAVREIRTRVMTRAFVIGNMVFIALIIGALTLTAVLKDDPNKPVKVGVVGQASQLGEALAATGESLKTRVELRAFGSEVAARAALLDGDVKVILVPAGEGFVARADKTLNPTLRAVLTSAVQQRAVSAALRKEGVNPLLLAGAAQGATLEVQFNQPPKKDADERTAITLGIIFLLYAQLFSNGVTVATGVVEEKTSRLAELLLGAIKPVHLLAGKVVGIGLVGLLQLAAFGIVGLVAGAATGVVQLSSVAVISFVSALGWYVLGYLMLGTLYAAAGSLVSKQEEVGSAIAPMSVIVISMLIVAQVGVEEPSGQLSNVMSWIPPYSAMLMPLRIAAGVTTPFQIVGTALLMLATASVLAVLAGRVYQASILRTGQGLPWRRRKAVAA